MTPVQIYKHCSPAVVEIQAYNIQGIEVSKGSGWAYTTKDGITLIVTAKHVIDEAGMTYQVVDKWLRVYKPVGSWKSSVSALGVLKVRDCHIKTLPLGKTPPVGSKVYDIGYPLEEDTQWLGFGNMASSDWKGYCSVFLNAAPGDSGSPLLNRQGRVIGIVCLQFRDSQAMFLCLNEATLRKELKELH